MASRGDHAGEQNSRQEICESFHTNIVKRQLELLQRDFERNTTVRSRLESKLLDSGLIEIEIHLAPPANGAQANWFEMHYNFSFNPLQPASYHCSVRLDLMEIYFFVFRFFHRPGLNPAPPVHCLSPPAAPRRTSSKHSHRPRERWASMCNRQWRILWGGQRVAFESWQWGIFLWQVSSPGQSSQTRVILIDEVEDALQR